MTNETDQGYVGTAIAELDAEAKTRHPHYATQAAVDAAKLRRVQERFPDRAERMESLECVLTALKPTETRFKVS